MIILALDTTTDMASVAVRRDGNTLSEQSIITTDGHSYLIFQMIRSVLESTRLTLKDVNCFASAVGPGSFTGVRICLAAVKGLADALEKPAAGISNLRALATFSSAKLRNPVIDARRGQLYTAIYDSDLNLLSDEIVIPANEWAVAAGVDQITSKPSLAAAIAFCAELDGPEKWVDPALLDARYVRRSDAGAMWVDTRSFR